MPEYEAGQGPVSRKSWNFAGDIILFVSWKRRRSKTRNFAFILIFIPFTSCEKTSPTEQVGRSFTDGFSYPKRFRDFRETGRRTETNLESEIMWLKNSTTVLNINFGKTLLKTRKFSISWLSLMYNKKTRYHWCQMQILAKHLSPSLQGARVDFQTSVLVCQLQPNSRETNKVDDIIFWGNKEESNGLI